MYHKKYLFSIFKIPYLISMYTILKDDIPFLLNGSPNGYVYACAFQRRPCLWLLPYMFTSVYPLRYGWSAAAPW
jgi:hypothetical protein